MQILRKLNSFLFPFSFAIVSVPRFLCFFSKMLVSMRGESFVMSLLSVIQKDALEYYFY